MRHCCYSGEFSFSERSAHTHVFWRVVPAGIKTVARALFDRPPVFRFWKVVFKRRKNLAKSNAIEAGHDNGKICQETGARRVCQLSWIVISGIGCVAQAPLPAETIVLIWHSGNPDEKCLPMT